MNTSNIVLFAVALNCFAAMASNLNGVVLTEDAGIHLDQSSVSYGRMGKLENDNLSFLHLRAGKTDLKNARFNGNGSRYSYDKADATSFTEK